MAPRNDHLWISTFLEAQAAELGAANNTLLAYGRDLKDFANWTTRSNTGFTSASRDQIEAYLIDCDAQGLSRATRARRLSAIKQLYRFAFDEGWRSETPPFRSRDPGVPSAFQKRSLCPKLTNCLAPPERLGAAPKTGCATPA